MVFFFENASKSELKELIINYLTIDEKVIKNEIKRQWNNNAENKTIGIKGINIQIKGVK